MKKILPIILLVASVLFLILASSMPAADVPIKVYDSAVTIAPLFYIISIVLAYLSLAVSSKKPLFFVVTFIIIIIGFIGMNSIIDDLYQCFTYYIPG